MEKKILTGLTVKELEDFFQDIGEKPFRGRQLFNWLYVRKAASFEEMTSLSKSLREKLVHSAQISCLHMADRKESPASGAIKYLFELADGHKIESVFIPENDRRTLCISSQVGCALNCRFCATARLGFKRNLTPAEIVEQVAAVSRDTGQDLTNVVFMGMGEPFMNYDNVIKAAYLINHMDGLAISSRHIVISTAGVVDRLLQYTDEKHKFKLAISLNSPFEEQRCKIMPITKKWDLDVLLKAVKRYVQKSKLRPTFEYVLLAGINDTHKEAREIIRLMKNIPCKINVIPYNESIDAFKRPDTESVERFAQWIRDELKAPVSVRWSKGDDIDAACGQLAAKHANKSITG